MEPEARPRRPFSDGLRALIPPRAPEDDDAEAISEFILERLDAEALFALHAPLNGGAEPWAKVSELLEGSGRQFPFSNAVIAASTYDGPGEIVRVQLMRAAVLLASYLDGPDQLALLAGIAAKWRGVNGFRFAWLDHWYGTVNVTTTKEEETT